MCQSIVAGRKSYVDSILASISSERLRPPRFLTDPEERRLFSKLVAATIQLDHTKNPSGTTLLDRHSRMRAATLETEALIFAFRELRGEGARTSFNVPSFGLGARRMLPPLPPPEGFGQFGGRFGW